MRRDKYNRLMNDLVAARTREEIESIELPQPDFTDPLIRSLYETRTRKLQLTGE